MQTKNVVTIILLAFVGVSIGYLVWQELRPPTCAVQCAFHCPFMANKANTTPTPELESPLTPASQALSQKITIYYFHTHMRCPTCMKFEAYTKEILETKFTEQIKNGSIEFRVINVEEPGNEHFVNDYQLFTKSIVISKSEGGKETSWKNLDKIWQLVHQREAFEQYVMAEVSAFLGEVQQERQ